MVCCVRMQRALERRHQPRRAAFTARRGEFGEQPRGAPVEHGIAFAAGFVAQCATSVSVAAATGLN
jgi:hypothetical protein